MIMLVRVIVLVVVIMRMGVLVVVTMTAAAGAMRVIVMGMAVVMAVIMPAAGGGGDIGAAFGIERRLDLGQLHAEPADKDREGHIAADAQLEPCNLHRHAMIAQSPGESREIVARGAANFGERLRRGDHFHDGIIIEQQAVAAAQHDGFGQVQQIVAAPDAFQRGVAILPVGEFENDRVEGLAGP